MTNILTNIEGEIEKWIKKGMNLLLNGELYDFENWLSEKLNGLYNEIMSAILTQIGTSKEFVKKLGKKRCALGLGKLKRRKVKLQIKTGEYIEFESYYAERGRNYTYQGCFHLSLVYWHCLKKASPSYYSTAGLLSILCPSFDIASQVLEHLGIKGKYNRIRTLSIFLGKKGNELGASSSLEKGESVEGKRVVVTMDGGRSRTRQYTGEVNEKGNAKFLTPWKEPKVFVIQVLTKQGKPDKKFTLPIYGASLASIDEIFNKLADTLQQIQIDKAKEIQFIADGAPCYWNSIRAFFIKLGVSPKKMTFTLDYYHAVEHLNDLVKLLPMEEEDKPKCTKQFMNFLWDGAIYSIEKRVKKCLKKVEQTITDELKAALNTALNYFIRHTDHMQYYKYKKRKWLCGSGLMESAIRRIINLRFKGASSFWLLENLEQLLLLRCTFLAGRWNIFISNLVRN